MKLPVLKFRLYNLIIYTGILTLCFLLTTFIIGMFFFNLTLHLWSASLTIFFACLHAGLVLYKYIKIKRNRRLL
ncbi:MAG: hypothetical protein WC412_04845 [Candidatus Omnitrophota bacterium]